jgi:hypothetical protein
MSETESPVDTVIRLLSQNMRVVKKDGSLASIVVSREWVDRELFKNVDGQVTVGLAESRDTKIEMSGRLRRRVGSLRVNVWGQDSYIRQKMVEEVNRIVRQNRNSPGGNISYLDVVSYRDVDRVDLKPFIYCTEFTLKSWSFEDIGGVF